MKTKQYNIKCTSKGVVTCHNENLKDHIRKSVFLCAYWRKIGETDIVFKLSKS